VKCIVGLGNPGVRYRTTRHNIGFLVAESLIGSFPASVLERNHLFDAYMSSIAGQETAVMMPQTYMNDSGSAVLEFQQRYSVSTEDILIMFDDFQLPFGTLRMRSKGSGGGHNGLASIIDHLEIDLVPRLRIGVGGLTMPDHHTHESMADYVLSPFDAEEQKLLPRLYQHTRDACVSWVGSGIEKTMSQYNRNFFSSASAE
jgi:PTH1 family peptidyl-tRNA hydrolase